MWCGDPPEAAGEGAGFRFDPPIVADTPLRFDTKLKCTVTEVRYNASESLDVVQRR